MTASTISDTIFYDFIKSLFYLFYIQYQNLSRDHALNINNFSIKTNQILQTHFHLSLLPTKNPQTFDLRVNFANLHFQLGKILVTPLLSQ